MNCWRSNADSYDGLRIKGYVALMDRKLPEAVEQFRKANLVRPMQAEVVLALGQTLVRNNQSAEAEQLAREAIAKDKTFDAAYRILYGILMSSGRTAEAETLLKSLVEASPTQSDHLMALAQHYVLVKKPADMNATLQRLIDNPKDFPQARLQVGDFYSRIGDMQAARHQYEAGVEAAPAEKTVYRKRIAGVLIRLGLPDEALAVADAILKENPEDEATLQGKAALLLNRGGKENVDAAIASFESLVAKKPGDAGRLFDLGSAYQVKGDLDAAQKEYLEAAKRGENFAPPRLALAKISIQNGEFDDALTYLNEILMRTPKDSQARLLRAVALSRAQRYGAARSELQSFLRDHPDDAEAQLQLAVVNLAGGHLNDAESGFLKLYHPGQADLRPSWAWQ